jgi:hypothetical protein
MDIPETPGRTDLPVWDREKGVISYDGSTLTVPAGSRVLLGDIEFYLLPLLPYQVAELRALLKQLLADPAIYYRRGSDFRLGMILNRLQGIEIPSGYPLEVDPLVVDDSMGRHV